MKTKIVILVLITFLILCLPVSATLYHPEMVYDNKTIIFADLGLTGTQEVSVWVGNVLVETGNTSAGELLQPIGDYQVIVKPQLSNRWLNNPVMFLQDGVAYLLAFALPIFIILSMIGIAFGLAHYGRKH